MKQKNFLTDKSVNIFWISLIIFLLSAMGLLVGSVFLVTKNPTDPVALAVSDNLFPFLVGPILFFIGSFVFSFKISSLRLFLPQQSPWKEVSWFIIRTDRFWVELFDYLFKGQYIKAGELYGKQAEKAGIASLVSGVLLIIIGYLNFLNSKQAYSSNVPESLILKNYTLPFNLLFQIVISFIVMLGGMVGTYHWVFKLKTKESQNELVALILKIFFAAVLMTLFLFGFFSFSCTISDAFSQIQKTSAVIINKKEFAPKESKAGTGFYNHCSKIDLFTNHYLVAQDSNSNKYIFPVHKTIFAALKTGERIKLEYYPNTRIITKIFRF